MKAVDSVQKVSSIQIDMAPILVHLDIYVILLFFHFHLIRDKCKHFNINKWKIKSIPLI